MPNSGLEPGTFVVPEVDDNKWLLFARLQVQTLQSTDIQKVSFIIPNKNPKIYILQMIGVL